MISPGQIVLFPLPTTDRTPAKVRPALVLRKLPGVFDDWLVCMISSQLGQLIPGFDEQVAPGDSDFPASGLKTASIIRIARLAVVERSLLRGSIGKIGPDRLRRVIARLDKWIAAKGNKGTGKKIDPKAIFDYAEAFAEAAGMLTVQAERTPGRENLRPAEAGGISPMDTLDMFALELYLKCLHASDCDGDMGWGHNPSVLFGELKPGTQQAIRRTYADRLGTDPMVAKLKENHPGFRPDLDRCLRDADHFFEDARYLFEERKTERKDGPRFYWPMVRFAVRDAIVLSYPRWAT